MENVKDIQLLEKVDDNVAHDSETLNTKDKVRKADSQNDSKKNKRSRTENE